MTCFINREGQQFGPFSWDEVGQYVRQGSIRTTDFVWSEGAPSWTPLSTALAMTPSSTLLRQEKKVGGPFTWPFQNKDWAKSLWMPMLWWFSAPFFPLGILLNGGWYLDAVRRKATKNSCPLPDSKDIGGMFGQGTMLALMTVFYFAIPLTIISLLAGLDLPMQIWECIVWLWNAIMQNPHEPLGPFLIRQALKLGEHALAPGAYLAVATPLFAVAELKYAITSRASSFFDIFGNVALVFRHLGEFILLLFFRYVVGAVSLALRVVLAATILGLPLAVLTGAAETWVMAYLAGDLAGKIQRR